VNVAVAAAAEDQAYPENLSSDVGRSFDSPRDLFLIAALVGMYRADSDLISLEPAALVQHANEEKHGDLELQVAFSDAELQPVLNWLVEKHHIAVDKGRIYKLV